MITATETNATATANLQIGGVDPDVGPVALDRPLEEGLHLAIDLLAQPADLAFGHAAGAHGLDQVVDRAGRDALDIGLLYHRGERLLRHPARLEETREIRSLPQLRDAQFYTAGPRLPVPVPVSVALDKPQRALLAVAGPGGCSHLHLHQPLGGEANHLAQQIGIRTLLYQRAQVHHVVGHRSFLESGWCHNPTHT